MKKYLIVIPARYKSSRLPGKPLILLNGIPMLKYVWDICTSVVDKKNVVLATDSEKIKRCCIKYNINFIMTSKKCLTGTDRVFEVAKKIKAKTYINVQGDEPLLSPDDLKIFIAAALKNPKLILNAMNEVNNQKEYVSLNVPKVVVNNSNFLLYMSRAKIPSSKNNKFSYALKQVCMYSFPRKELFNFGKNNNKTFFENIEDIEILRFLEMGSKVKMIKVFNPSIGVDTIQDAVRVSRILKLNHNN